MTRVSGLVRTLPAPSTAILLVGQRARQGPEISGRDDIPDAGRVVLHGPAREPLADPPMARLCLGGA